MFSVPNDKPEAEITNPGGPSEVSAGMPDIPSTIAPDTVESEETSDVPAEVSAEALPPTPPQSDLPDETSPDNTAVVANEDNACALPVEEENACALPPDVEPAEDTVTSTSADPEIVEATQQRRAALPYTFHFITGNNIKLCSSSNILHKTVNCFIFYSQHID